MHGSNSPGERVHAIFSVHAALFQGCRELLRRHLTVLAHLFRENALLDEHNVEILIVGAADVCVDTITDHQDALRLVPHLGEPLTR